VAIEPEKQLQTRMLAVQMNPATDPATRDNQGIVHAQTGDISVTIVKTFQQDQ